MAVLSLLLLGGLWSAVGASNMAVVTCGSVVKLLNTRHNVRLHSHDVRYGSESPAGGVRSIQVSSIFRSILSRDLAEFITATEDRIHVLVQGLKGSMKIHKWLSQDILFHSSGQQSVTGVTSVDDSNSYWRIRGKTATVCERGTPIKCGQPIRLTHINTGRNLHSHHFTSPLSGNQEVSAFGEEGEGDYLDDWTVL
ncbi:stromal cell-derived factor 2 isoform 5 precursor [Mus musculus]|nr:stromal cell-derived factor 2 isoform 5 precursor [Mus musculus]